VSVPVDSTWIKTVVMNSDQICVVYQ